LEAALEFLPQEIYLYPLYVRPLTGLSRLGRVPTDHRLELYRAGREHLLTRGYRQVSMRLFRRGDYAPPEGPVYCCQEDGMLGLGAGARSYSSALHYSTEFAVSRPGVQGILQDFTERTGKQFAWADYGCRLDSEEQRRRYVLKSVLRVDGLSLADYRSHFGTDAFEDLPQLTELLEEELAESPDGMLRLNARGFEASDVIGPWLASPSVRSRMESFALR
jgi:oxygen-independent coproporphyrinogen-3 oxidase